MERRYPTIHEENCAYLQLKEMEDLSSHRRNFQITTTKEDLLTSMVKEKRLIRIDELEDFLKNLTLIITHHLPQILLFRML